MEGSKIWDAKTSFILEQGADGVLVPEMRRHGEVSESRRVPQPCPRGRKVGEMGQMPQRAPAPSAIGNKVPISLVQHGDDPRPSP